MDSGALRARSSFGFLRTYGLLLLYTLGLGVVLYTIIAGILLATILLVCLMAVGLELIFWRRRKRA